MGITKELFKESIEALRDQYDYDIMRAKLLGRALEVPTSEVSTYDNSKLTDTIFGLLRTQFPAVDGGCEIERFCYSLNFGRIDKGSVNPIEDFWNYMIGELDVVSERVTVGLEVEYYKKYVAKNPEL